MINPRLFCELSNLRKRLLLLMGFHYRRGRWILDRKPISLNQKITVLRSIDNIGKARIASFRQNKIIDFPTIAVTWRLPFFKLEKFIFKFGSPIPERLNLFSLC